MHSSQPHLGHNALLAAANLIVELEKEHQSLLLRTSPLGAPTLVTTLADGGVAVNIVPPAASITIDRRVVVGEEAATVVADLKALAARHARAHDAHVTVDADVRAWRPTLSAPAGG